MSEKSLTLVDQLRSRPFHTSEINIPLYTPKSISERVFKVVSAQCDRMGLKYKIKRSVMPDGRIQLMITAKGLGKQLVMLLDDLESFVEANSVLR